MIPREKSELLESMRVDTDVHIYTSTLFSQLFSEWGPWASSMSTTWETATSASSWVSCLTY